MTTVSRFRLFGRAASGPPPYPAPAYGTPPPLAAAWPQAAPAPMWPASADDPPTDPYGFPPVPPLEPVPLHPATAFPAPPAAPSAAPGYPSPPPASPTYPPSPTYPAPPAHPAHPAPPAHPAAPSNAPDPAEASSLAGAFAADYLSWDEDDPARRGRVLLDYLSTPGGDPARLGWSGRGRQRAEFALPGQVRPDGDGRVLVDVRVRVTPYRSVGEHGPDNAAEPEPEVAGIPAVAPAPTGRGWRSLASYWIRISVPVATEGGRLVVDLREETLDEEPASPARPPAPAVDDHLLADDAPIGTPPVPSAPQAPPAAGGAW